MKMRDFIRSNRAEIDTIINYNLFRWDGNGGPGTVPDPPPKRNDKDRQEWILNDEILYRWARREGVRV